MENTKHAATRWTATPFDKELDGYPVFSPEGLAAIATDPEYQERIVRAVNAHGALVAAIQTGADIQHEMSQQRGEADCTDATPCVFCAALRLAGGEETGRATCDSPRKHPSNNHQVSDSDPSEPGHLGNPRSTYDA